MPNDSLRAERADNLTRIWQNLPGWGTLACVNHTDLGKRFIVTGLIFFLIGGVLAMLLRTQLAQPAQDIIAPEIYAQLFTMHGTVMMFLFAIPVLEGLAIYLIPKMIGARDLVFPRLTALGYYCYLFGGLILISSLFLGVAPDSGWFLYTPLSSEYAPGPGSDFWLLGITFVEISAMAAGIELTVSILRSRAPGMKLMQMPIFCWYILGMALMIVFGFPPLILASILLELERAAGLPFFEVTAGGDPLLWQHLFWLFGHPEVYIIFLPAAGVISTLIPVFAGHALIGYRWLVLSVVLTAFLSFGLWVHHMFTVGIPHVAQAFFSAASMLIAVPTAIQIFAWLATLWSGKRLSGQLPMLWIFGFLVIFVLGGLTGVMLALVPFNWQVHDTHFVVAHLHYVLIGGMLFPLIAGLYYWLPQVSGRMPSDGLGRWGYWLTFLGFNGTFFFMHLTGLLGMPRRIATYHADQGWTALNLLSSVSGFVMAAGIALVMIDLILHFRFGRPADRNPWQADTLEWAVASPPPPYNFASVPQVVSPHPLWHTPDLGQRLDDGAGLLAHPQPIRRETLGTSTWQAQVLHVIHLPGNSWLPLLTAAALAVVCIGLLLRSYGVALLATGVALALSLVWTWRQGAGQPRRECQPEAELPAPLHWQTASGPGLWGMQTALLANASLFVCYLFSWWYLWWLAPAWSLPSHPPLSFASLLWAGAPLLLGWLCHEMATARASGQQSGGVGMTLTLGAAAGLASLALLAAMVPAAELAPRSNTHDAMLMVLWLYVGLHVGLSTIATILQTLRWHLGLVSAQHPYELRVLRPLWRYTALIYGLGVLACALPSWLASSAGTLG